MTFQYDVEIAKTKSGAVDLDFYIAEASRMRSEHLKATFKSAVKAVRKIFISKRDISHSATNMFLVEKLAR